jgi:hypothetical protein
MTMTDHTRVSANAWIASQGEIKDKTRKIELLNSCLFSQINLYFVNLNVLKKLSS